MDEITYPKDKGDLISYGIDTGMTSPFNPKHIKKSADAVQKGNEALKRKAKAKFNEGPPLRNKRGKQVTASITEAFDAMEDVFDHGVSKSGKGGVVSIKKVKKLVVKELKKVL